MTNKIILFLAFFLISINTFSTKEPTGKDQNQATKKDAVQESWIRKKLFPITPEKIFTLFFCLRSVIFYFDTITRRYFQRRGIKKKFYSLSSITDINQHSISYIKNILHMNPSKINVVPSTSFKNFQIGNDDLYTFISIYQLKILQTGTDKEKFILYGPLAHENIHRKGQHTIKLLITSSYIVTILFYCVYALYKKYENKLYNTMERICDKYKKISSPIKYIMSAILGNLLPIASIALGVGIVQKTLGRYFERCADNFTHKNKTELEKLRFGLISFLQEINNDPLYQKHKNSWGNFFFGPHDPIEIRIAAIEERIKKDSMVAN